MLNIYQERPQEQIECNKKLERMNKLVIQNLSCYKIIKRTNIWSTVKSTAIGHYNILRRDQIFKTGPHTV
jgi:hypothetical protein